MQRAWLSLVNSNLPNGRMAPMKALMEAFGSDISLLGNFDSREVLE